VDASEPEIRSRQLEETHRKAMRVHVSAAKQHRQAAERHRRAAVHQEVAAFDGIGDTEQHREAAASERAASLWDSQAADRESQMARLESHRLADALEDRPPQTNPNPDR
jgi:hypothetical protein